MDHVSSTQSDYAYAMTVVDTRAKLWVVRSRRPQLESVTGVEDSKGSCKNFDSFLSRLSLYDH